METTRNINNAFGPGTANEQCTAGSRNFAKETRVLKVRSQPSEVDNNQLRGPSKPYLPDLSLTNCLPLLKHLNNFVQRKCFHNQQEAVYAFLRSFSNPKARIFMLQE